MVRGGVGGGTRNPGCLSYTDSRVTVTETGIITLFLESNTFAETLRPTNSASDTQNINLKNFPDLSKSTQASRAHLAAVLWFGFSVDFPSSSIYFQ